MSVSGRVFLRVFISTGVVSSDVTPRVPAFHPGQLCPRQVRVVFFGPNDFTFVCPTEIAAFGQALEEFRVRAMRTAGASIDSEYVHPPGGARRGAQDPLPRCLL